MNFGKRGLSPLISSVLLIAFVVTIFLVISTWIQSGVVEEATSRSDDKLSRALASNEINFKIRNVNLVDDNTVRVSIENIGIKP